MKKLSVIIIGRNEEKHISRCLKSVILAIGSVTDTEVIYSDSASTDNTIPIVRDFPVTIVQLKKDWPLSASAGRYIGTIHSRGEFLMFIDGDTVLFRNWISRGIDYLIANPGAAAVAGSVHEIFEDEHGKPVDLVRNRYGSLNEPREEKTLGGIALYRRSVLDRTGSFNPFIRVDEERELGLRIRREGLTLIRIPDPMAITYGPIRESVQELKRRAGSGLYSFGKTLKYCQKQGFFRQYLSERLGFITSFLLALSVAVILLVFLILNGILFPAFWMTCIVVLILRLMKPVLFNRLYVSFAKRTLMSFHTIQSYCTTRPCAVSDYPVDAIPIRKKGLK